MVKKGISYRPLGKPGCVLESITFMPQHKQQNALRPQT